MLSGSRYQVSSLPSSENADVAAHGQGLAIGADGHLGFIDLAVARIENVAVLIFQTVALHVPDEGNAEHRCILAVVGAFRADLIGVFAGQRKHLGDGALENAVVIDHQKPDHRFAVFQFLPQPRRAGFGRQPPTASIRTSAANAAIATDVPQSKSGSCNPHQLSSPGSGRAMNEDYGHFTDGSSAADGHAAQFSAFRCDSLAITPHLRWRIN